MLIVNKTLMKEKHNYSSYIHQLCNYYVYRTIYLFSVIPATNTVRVLILYRNITNICHKLIIYSDWTHFININFIAYTVDLLLYIITCFLCTY